MSIKLFDIQGILFAVTGQDPVVCSYRTGSSCLQLQDRIQLFAVTGQDPVFAVTGQDPVVCSYRSGSSCLQLRDRIQLFAVTGQDPVVCSYRTRSSCLQLQDKIQLFTITGQDPIWIRKQKMFVEQGTNWKEIMFNQQQIILSFYNNILNTVNFK
jgi:hypothetical protein